MAEQARISVGVVNIVSDHLIVDSHGLHYIETKYGESADWSTNQRVARNALQTGPQPITFAHSAQGSEVRARSRSHRWPTDHVAGRAANAVGR